MCVVHEGGGVGTARGGRETVAAFGRPLVCFDFVSLFFFYSLLMLVVTLEDFLVFSAAASPTLLIFRVYFPPMARKTTTNYGFG